MRTVLGRSAGRVTLILVSAGMVGSAAFPAVPAAAGAGNPRISVHHQQSDTQIGDAVKFVKDGAGAVHRVR
jgi:hypothetical protein